MKKVLGVRCWVMGVGCWLMVAGVFSSGRKGGLAMLQHEFGHVLQYRKVGPLVYYNIIAKKSMVNCIRDRVFGNDTHSTFWTETWANYLSKQYFGDKWLGLETKISGKELRYFPSKNITLINILNLF